MLVLFAAAMLAASNAPPPQNPNAAGPIVVQGVRGTRKQIDHYVDQLAPAAVGTQLGRFLEPVCPLVAGLPGNQNALVEARMLKVAAAIGAPVARSTPPKCRPNVYVLVGPDKRETIAGLRKQFPAMVAGVPGSLLRRLAAAPGPVAAWQIVGRIGTDGMPMGAVRTADGPGTPSDSVMMAVSVGDASRIVHITRSQFLASVLVIDARALDGVDTRQLADYAIMRTLAPTDTTHQAAVAAPSIIKLFDPGAAAAAPPSVTWWDFAFLKALYASSNDVDAWQQKGEIAHRMGKELAKVPPPPEE